MTKIRYSEVFTSIQGEGMHAGQPSTFVRLYGCNFTCAGFGLGSGATVKPVDFDRVRSVSELDGNSFTVGCDSRYSWHPEFKHLQTLTTARGLAKDIEQHLRQEQLRTDNVDHVVWTGGEPLLHQRVLIEAIEHLPFTHITFETNASVVLENDFIEYLVNWIERNRRRTILFSNSPKLAHSGEPAERRINPDATESQRALAARIMQSGMGSGAVFQTFKYVVGDRVEHFEEAREMHYALTGFGKRTDWRTLRALNAPMAMPLGATWEQYRAVCRGVADLCLDYGFRYCARTHLDLFGNEVGT